MVWQALERLCPGDAAAARLATLPPRALAALLVATPAARAAELMPAAAPLAAATWDAVVLAAAAHPLSAGRSGVAACLALALCAERVARLVLGARAAWWGGRFPAARAPEILGGSVARPPPGFALFHCCWLALLLVPHLALPVAPSTLTRRPSRCCGYFEAGNARSRPRPSNTPCRSGLTQARTRARRMMGIQMVDAALRLLHVDTRAPALEAAFSVAFVCLVLLLLAAPASPVVSRLTPPSSLI
jgi:hypothetical protein